MPKNRKPKSSCFGCLFYLILFTCGGIWLVNKSDFSNKNMITNLSNLFDTFLTNTSISQTPSPIFSPPPTPESQPTFPSFPFPQTVAQGTTIKINGSTSMAQLNKALQQGFQQQFSQTTVTIDAISSDASIMELLAQKIDLAAVSRPLTDSEKQQGLIAIPITQDGIAIITGVNNPYRRSLTQTQIQEIFQGKITNWSELGGVNQPIRVIHRPESSETRQVFSQMVLKGQPMEKGANFITLDRDEITDLIQALGEDGISYGFYSQVVNQLTARIIPINGLIPEAIDYPYQRQLFYVYQQPASPQVAAFLGYATSELGQAKIAEGLIEPPIEEIAQTAPKTLSPVPTVSSNSTNTKNLITDVKSRRNQAIRAIYLSRYQVTNNASEDEIRQRVRYYHSQGINTIIHGVWGNGCTMYQSEVMQKRLGYSSCPNEFNEQWLDWLIDEAHKNNMQVHAYFEKGIKIDKNSSIYQLALANNWLVPGVDKTYGGIDHYVLNIEVPEVASFFKEISVEFVQKYPQIDAVQWDDYLGYHAELPGQVDRTRHLTVFMQQLIKGIKQANPQVSFDLCHHNPYWAKRYFAADWEQWNVDRVFIQAYNEKNFKEELIYAQSYDGIAITDQQLDRLKELVNNPQISNILVFPLSGKPEETSSKMQKLMEEAKSKVKSQNLKVKNKNN